MSQPAATSSLNSSQTDSSDLQAKTNFRTGRRQHRSCDQCRKGKRACDVAFAKEVGRKNEEITALGPCSNCQRTGKNCTLQWLRAVHRAAIQPHRNPPTLGLNRSETRVPANSLTCSNDESSGQPGFTRHSQQLPLRSTYSYPLSPPTNDDVLGPLFFPLNSDTCTSTGNWNSTFEDIQYAETQHSRWSTAIEDDFLLDDEVPSTELQPDFASVIAPPGIPTSSSGCSSEGIYLPDTTWDPDENVEASENVQQSVRSGFSPWTGGYSRGQSSSAASFNSVFEYLQPSHPQSRLATSVNQSVLTKGLWKVYHDSFENALSCWLTEKNCPYTSSVILPTNPSTESMAEVWGPTWGNRIIQRVCRLDKSWSRLGNRPIRPSEDRAASRALQLSIMAFATQWAQGSCRSSADYCSAHDVDGSQAPFPLDGEFDRVLQESFWYQARRALQDAADSQSFRVVLAHVIFSFTQRPLNLEQHIQDISPGERRSNDSSRVNEIIESDGPPIFLEAATRQIFSQRSKLQRAGERVPGQRGRTDSTGMQDGVDGRLDSMDRKTFDMLFWLCVMFDTLSAVMNERPLVVSDQDTGILPNTSESSAEFDYPVGDHLNQDCITMATTSPTDGGANLWGDFFLNPTEPGYYKGTARWPCSYEEAATMLCNGAPVKVLLYRKVAHLQTLLSRGTRNEKLEAAIREALRVYQHWNRTYGRFILDCVNDHDNLPARIQSWYIVLAGHWHLAALCLADMIQQIDEAKMGLDSQRHSRQSCRLSSVLRKENTYAISDLGRVSCPSATSSFPAAPEYHSAVNKGALLTEPWTIVLVRSFAKAGRVLLDYVPVLNQPLSGIMSINFTAVAEDMRRCEHCIKALWYLGKKSDMAFLAATALSNDLKGKAANLWMHQTSDVPDGYNGAGPHSSKNWIWGS